MNIIVAGIMGRHPYGGVAWCSLMYLLGLRKLGHKVWYLEDTGEANFDPVGNTLRKNPKYAHAFIDRCLKPYRLQGRWCYIDWRGRYSGYNKEDWLRICAGADLLLNLSGGCAFWRDEYARIPFTAYIDSDPAFTQIRIDTNRGEQAEFFARYNSLFTFGSNIGTPQCSIPTGNLNWQHTWQPISLDEWTLAPATPDAPFTTIMSWEIESFKEIGGNKDIEFLNVIDLPSMTSVPLELAVSGPQALLREHGWACRNAFSVSHDPDSYRRYIRASGGEFSVAKHTYVVSNSGWFSDRTECYLASGKPAVVQDTGFSTNLPTGSGLLAFRDVEEAKRGLEAVRADYSAHSKAARELAEAHFGSDKVLSSLLERATQPSAAKAGF